MIGVAARFFVIKWKRGGAGGGVDGKLARFAPSMKIINTSLFFFFALILAYGEADHLDKPAHR
jgi:hypothetical protein